MANRSFFLPQHVEPFYTEKTVTFEYHPGFALSQQQKSIKSMHAAIQSQFQISEILEISTKSESPLGVSLSAFNLTLQRDGRTMSIEALYQSCKRFKNAGPFYDISYKSARDAKKDPRILNSGNLMNFEFEGLAWPLVPSPNFYDYLYISALSDFQHNPLVDNFQAFTDFAFSTQAGKQRKGQSWNCQARSFAIYRSLSSHFDFKGLVEKVKQLALSRDREIGTHLMTLF
jgi:hypothetical protein